MIKYRGKYRIVYEIDNNGKPCEFSFIPCGIKRGANITRHNDNILNVYIPSVKKTMRLLREYPDIFKPFIITDGEGILLFNERYIDKACKILRARIQGKNLSPRAKRNARIFKKPVLLSTKTG